MLRLVGVLGVTVGLSQCSGLFLVVDVADPLQEQKWEDVGLEVRCVYWPAKDVGGIPEPRFDRAFRIRGLTHWADAPSVH